MRQKHNRRKVEISFSPKDHAPIIGEKSAVTVQPEAIVLTRPSMPPVPRNAKPRRPKSGHLPPPARRTQHPKTQPSSYCKPGRAAHASKPFSHRHRWAWLCRAAARRLFGATLPGHGLRRQCRPRRRAELWPRPHRRGDRRGVRRRAQALLHRRCQGARVLQFLHRHGAHAHRPGEAPRSYGADARKRDRR